MGRIYFGKMSYGKFQQAVLPVPSEPMHSCKPGKMIKEFLIMLIDLKHRALSKTGITHKGLSTP